MFRIIFVLIVLNVSSNVFSADTTLIKSSLLNEFQNKSVYLIEKETLHCPSFFVLKKYSNYSVKSQRFPDNENIIASMAGHELSKNGDEVVSSNWFTHGNYLLHFVLDLPEDKQIRIGRKCMVTYVGGGCTKETQRVSEGKLIYENSVKMLSLIMTGYRYNKVEYNPREGTIKNHFSTNGIEDLNCNYKRVKDNSKYLEMIKKYRSRFLPKE